VIERRAGTPSQKEAKRQHILSVAAHEFAVYGFVEANINTIADLSGVGKGTMYRYAEDKEDLFNQVLEEATKRIQQALDDALAESAALPLYERLQLITTHMLTLDNSLPDWVQVHTSALYGPGYRGFKPQAVAFLRHLSTTFEALFAEELAAGRIRDLNTHKLALTFLTLVHTFSRLPYNLEADRKDAPGLFLADVLWRGIQP
jgi:AcrR family transcriptional regulator